MKHSFSCLFTLLLLSLIAQSQNVGVGTVAPDERLHVDSGHIKLGRFTWSTTANDRFIKIGDGSFVTIGEVGLDDRLQFSAREFLFVNSNGYGTGNGKVGINIAGSPSAYLEVNGNVKITDGTQAAGKVLTSDAAGNASWQQSPATNSAFRVLKSSNQSVGSSGLQLVDFPTTNFDDAGAFGGTSFVAPSAGVYHFDIKLGWSLAGGASRYTIATSLLTGFFELSRTQNFVEAGTSGLVVQQLSVDLKLSAGQSVAVYASHSASVNQNLQASFCSFNGHRLY